MSDLEARISGEFDALRDDLAFLPEGPNKALAIHCFRLAQQHAIEAIRQGYPGHAIAGEDEWKKDHEGPSA